MTGLFKKLQLPVTLDEIVVLNEPEGFSDKLKPLKNVTIIESLVQVSEVDFALVFVTEKKQIENRIETLYPKLIGDAVLWFVYPNEISKKHNSEITPDYGWSVLGDYNLKPTKEVVIDSDWVAKRFRKVAFIPKDSKQQPHTDKTPKTTGV